MEPALKVDVIGPEFEAQFQALVNQAFEVPEGSSFFDDFPVWDLRHRPSPLTQLRVGVFHGKTLVASACGRMAELKTPGMPLPVGLIGAVATHPDWRGKGLASKTVTLVSQWLEEKTAALQLLWGSEHHLYQRLGFQLCGQQIRVPLGELGSSPAPQAEVRRGWDERLLAVLQARPGGLRLTQQDARWLGAHRHVRWYWLAEGTGVKAYAALGKGIDLHGLVHEWGGEETALRALLSAIEQEHPGSALLGTPALPTLQEKLKIAVAPEAIEYLCMARVTDAQRIVAAFAPGHPFDARYLKFQDEEDLARFIFGPVLEGDATRPEPLPLPLWIWGLDGA